MVKLISSLLVLLSHSFVRHARADCPSIGARTCVDGQASICVYAASSASSSFVWGSTWTSLYPCQVTAAVNGGGGSAAGSDTCVQNAASTSGSSTVLPPMGRNGANNAGGRPDPDSTISNGITAAAISSSSAGSVSGSASVSASVSTSVSASASTSGSGSNAAPSSSSNIPLEPRLSASLAANVVSPTSQSLASWTGSAASGTDEEVISAWLKKDGKNQTLVVPGQKRFAAYWSAWSLQDTFGGTRNTISIPSECETIYLFALDTQTWAFPSTNPHGMSANDFFGNTKANFIHQYETNFTGQHLPSKLNVVPTIGGWGVTTFRNISATDATRHQFAVQAVNFLATGGFDGLDIDWEYPAGDGTDYGTTAGSLDGSYTELYRLLLRSIRAEMIRQGVGQKILSIAVASKPGDIQNTVNTEAQASSLSEVVDWWNVMSYDYINRRDLVSGDAAGAGVIRNAIGNYSALGIDKDAMNAGWVFYAKGFPVPPTCTIDLLPSGCALVQNMEGLVSGVPYSDTGTSTTICFSSTWIGPNAGEVNNRTMLSSWTQYGQPHVVDGITSEDSYADYVLDSAMGLYWTFTSIAKIKSGCAATIDGVGGMFAFSLGQDTDDGAGMKALGDCVTAGSHS